MNAVVCTLFEGHYHFGVAALINSLYANGYTGEVYVGYRGDLPAWAKTVRSDETLHRKESKILQLNENLSVHFLPVTTTRHLTNYKSIFMLDLMQFTNVGVFYFDPDIVIKCPWSYFEEWITYGVAIVQEVVANHVSPNHPKRAKWNKIIESCGRKTERNLYNYFNGGFCGVSKKNIEFLETLDKIMSVGIAEYGMDDNYFSKKINQQSMFPVGDQDALNIAAMCAASNISDFGPEGMDFTGGGWLMSHATGKPKPWKMNYLTKALKGQKISKAEKNFWAYANGIISTMPLLEVKRKKTAIKIGSFINRFYARS